MSVHERLLAQVVTDIGILRLEHQRLLWLREVHRQPIMLLHISASITIVRVDLDKLLRLKQHHEQTLASIARQPVAQPRSIPWEMPLCLGGACSICAQGNAYSDPIEVLSGSLS